MGNWTVSDVLNSRMIYGATPEELLKLLEIAKHAASLAAAVHRRAIDSGGFEFDTKSKMCEGSFITRKWSQYLKT